jgi:Tol biopolymer transport system component
MEFIEGSLLTGPLPVPKVIEYACQTLDALDAAHRKGIVHRDLKPANILVTRHGIKLLDFGLAKQSHALSGPDADTVSFPSVEGRFAGTLRYMSPEQLQGREVDARSDIFSFGCILYEMLSGEKAFPADSSAGAIAAILDHDPKPLNTTPELNRIVRTCLAKDPEKRFQNALDLKLALAWAVESRAAATPGSRRLSWIPALAAGLVFGVLAVLWLFSRGPEPPETRVDIVSPPTSSPASFALSPDGRRIAWVASVNGPSNLWVRSLESTSAQLLPGTQGALNPFWSPDSRSIGFFADQNLKRVDLAGSQPEILGDADVAVAQGTWNKDGLILYSSGGRILRKTLHGGQPAKPLSLANAGKNLRAPRFLPDGRRFLFISAGTSPALWLGSADGDVAQRIAQLAPGRESSPEYLAPGWLVQVKQNKLTAQRFDANAGRLAGDPATLAESVGLDTGTLTGSFSVSDSGSIAWRAGAGTLRQLIWFDRSGRNAGSFGAPVEIPQDFPELSPDGRRVAISRGTLGARDIWIHEGIRDSRFTVDPADHHYAIWSPDGSRVVFGSNRNGKFDLYQKPADGSGSEELLLQSPEDKAPNSWSPDGRFILFSSDRNNGDLMVLPTFGDRTPFPFYSAPFNERQGVFSPDGKWIAYQSNESGQFQISVRPFPGPGGRWQLSTGGGIMPRWRADGKELFYIAPDGRLMATTVTVHGQSLIAGAPEPLFTTHIAMALNKQHYDVSRDGRLFLIDTELETTEPIHLLLNWKPPAK